MTGVKWLLGSNLSQFCELFCCLARDCNYRDEKLWDVDFKSGLYCTRQNIVFKALGCFGSFLKLYSHVYSNRNFMCAITSHKKQRAKYQMEMLLHIVTYLSFIYTSCLFQVFWMLQIKSHELLFEFNYYGQFQLFKWYKMPFEHFLRFRRNVPPEPCEQM